MNFTIKQARKHAGLTQADMATKMGMDRVTYIRLEKNEMQVTAARLYAVEKITGIPATVILDSIIKEHETAAPAVETQERRQKFVPESADGLCPDTGIKQKCFC